ncbi:hypothetical protein [Natrialba aegyptia]|nr:hypothetical protein [Natrialba aegyptia]
MRDKHIVLSDDEYERLEEVRQEIYGSESVPFGEVVNRLLEESDHE